MIDNSRLIYCVKKFILNARLEAVLKKYYNITPSEYALLEDVNPDPITKTKQCKVCKKDFQCYFLATKICPDCEVV